MTVYYRTEMPEGEIVASSFQHFLFDDGDVLIYMNTVIFRKTFFHRFIFILFVVNM